MSSEATEAEKPLYAPPRRRTRPSVRRCLGIGCLLGAAIFGSAIGWLFLSSLWTHVQSERRPHKSIYHEPTTDLPYEAEQAAGGVQPLFDRETKFDVALTIFARLPESQVDIVEAKDEEAQNREKIGHLLHTLEKITGMPEVELLRRPREVVLYEGVVLKGMSISRGRQMGSVDVEFDIPLDRFHDQYVYPHDIRGSVVLIPHDGSMFDRVQSHSDWRPEGAGPLPRYSERITKQYLADTRTAQQSLLRDFAVSFSLLQLHPPARKSNDTRSTPSPGMDTDNQEIYMTDEEEAKVNAEKDVAERRLKAWTEHTPYFVGRSHVYTIDETGVFNKTAFEKRHNKLKNGACGLGMGVPATRFLCHRTYRLNGHWEQLISLEPASPSDHPPALAQTAYAPFLGALRNMAGPQDLRAVPVTRPSAGKGDGATMHVSHRLVFSALTPARLHMLDDLVQSTSINASHTPGQMANAHDQWELTNGLFGSPAEGVHPWRRLIVAAIFSPSLTLANTILTPLYWYTRETTAGIHFVSALLFGAHHIISVTSMIIIGARSKLDWGVYITMTLFSLIELVIGIIILVSVSPIELKGWRLGRAQLDKRERQSRRMERQIKWEVWAAISAGILGFAYLSSHYHLHLFQPSHPTSDPDPDGLGLGRPAYLNNGLWTIAILSQLMQLDLNARAGTYAGGYAVTAFVHLGMQLCELAYYAPRIMGRVNSRDGVSWRDMVDVCLAGAWVYQAIKWRRVEQVVPEDDDERAGVSTIR